MLFHISSHHHNYQPHESLLQTDTTEGIKTLKLSLLILLATSALQVSVVLISGSVALLADTIHNFADAFTSIPLWIAFKLNLKKPSQKYNFGLGRVEDLAGLIILLIIFFSAVVAIYESIHRLLHPQVMTHVIWVVVASIIGFIGNEWVAIKRIKTGKKIGSASLIADGQHAHVDALTSLVVLVGAISSMYGFPLLDPLIGLGISAVIFGIVWQSAKPIFLHLLDGIEPEHYSLIETWANKTEGVQKITDIRARWSGHKILVEISIAVDPNLKVEDGHHIAEEVRQKLIENVPNLKWAMVHVDPAFLNYPQVKSPLKL